MKKLLLSGITAFFVIQAQAQLINPGFEMQNTTTGKPAFWQPAYYFLMPLDTNCTWTGLDSVSFSTSEAHTGNYAFEMRVATYCQSSEGGSIKPTLYDVDSFIDQRIPFSNRPAAFSFYYKLFPKLGDKGYVEVMLEDSSSHTVADAYLKLSQPAANWSLGIISLQYHSNDTPAFLTMKFRLSNDTGLHYGSRFLIDDIDLAGATGISSWQQQTTTLTCYPVPAKYELYIQTGGKIKGAALLTITDAMGRLVKTELTTVAVNNEVKLNVQDLPQGIYFVKLATGDATASGKFIK